MNFLVRAAAGPTPTHPLPPPVPAPAPESSAEPAAPHRKSLGGLMAEEASFGGWGREDGHGLSAGGHSDVADEEGWITIPREGLPEDWSDKLDVRSLCSLDRSFVFPGEQLNILTCLTTSKRDSEFINPFRVIEMMSKNRSLVDDSEQQNESPATDIPPAFENVDMDNGHQGVANEEKIANENTTEEVEEMNAEQKFSATESLIRTASRKHRTEALLERFNNSHFFARIAESDKPLWSKRSTGDQSSIGTTNNTNIDRGIFDGCTSSGVSRNKVRCFSLQNGDIVVLLQVNVGIDSLKDPVLEVLQFEKSKVRYLSPNYNQTSPAHEDPCGELLKWLYPLDSAISPPLPPSVGSVTSVAGAHHRPTLSASSTSQLFSFHNFRSYSMSSLPQNTVPFPADTQRSPFKHRPSLESFDHFSVENEIKTPDFETSGPLSFRGMQFEPEQFSVQCGLEGIYFPGKRWRKKLEIIQPLEVHSYAADCNTENLLSVQIKNVSPAHTPDLVIFIDAISIVFDEAPKSGPPLSLPISCIETGNGHGLPNLVLRRGEEHSFILRPSASMGRNFKVSSDKAQKQSFVQMGSMTGSNALKMSKIDSGTSLNLNTYAVLVSYRCNYSESNLFLKRKISWRPHDARDLMISVASEMSKQSAETDGKTPKLPFQELTLQASNLTSENLTLMVLAPGSVTAPPSVISLNSVPTTPVGPLAGFPEFLDRIVEKAEGNLQNKHIPEFWNEKESINTENSNQSFSPSQIAASGSNVLQNSDLGCSHLWLQSTVPLGCVPAQSSATVKLELLPLIDGIITLDTLQIAIKEKGTTYTPEHSLKIHATSSITTGIA